MLRMTIRQVGKTKETALQELVDAYFKRLKPFARIEAETVKGEQDLFQNLPSSAFTILLDAQGKQFSSEQFAQFIEERKNQGDSHLVFFIGPADGFDTEPDPDLKLSLSQMTFSHQSIRYLLAEQVYRTVMILEGKPFPR